MRFMVYFRIANSLVPACEHNGTRACWRIFDTRDEATAYAIAMAKEFTGFEYKVWRKL